MIHTAAKLSLYTSTSMPDALNMPISLASDLFESKTFDTWRKAREAETKIQAAIVNRLNEVIRALGVVAKITADK